MISLQGAENLNMNKLFLLFLQGGLHDQYPSCGGVLFLSASYNANDSCVTSINKLNLLDLSSAFHNLYGNRDAAALYQSDPAIDFDEI